MGTYYKQALSVGQFAVLDTLRGIIDSYKKSGRKYCFPSQDTLLEKLRAYHGIKICKRTLNNWLAKLERLGLIYRIRRLSHVRFTSTVYYLLDRGGAGVVRAKKIIGAAKRLRSVLPSRVKKIANDRHTAQCQYSGGGLKNRPRASGETKRCEASELSRQDVSAPEMETRPRESEERPLSMRECLNKVFDLHKARLLGKGRS